MTGWLGRGDVRFFDRGARLYDALMWPPRMGWAADAFGFADRPVERVLDLAGGTGRVAAALAPEYEPIVADVSAPMLSRATARGLQTVRSDAGRLPLRDDAVDAAVVVDAYHHLPDREAALAEAARVVAPGGVVVIRDFDPTTRPGRVIANAEALFGMASQFVAVDAAAQQLTRAGLHSRVLDRGTMYTVAGRVSDE
ncbi:class I SAM-dependent methyltransferase [Halolamina salifodinae]|uniref:Demethylmenaquinone methyltransferase/2-methoxy-6-polyprenyl-1,4-benzoquinol methylase n=1 Tax=Halolamina salifodinae TaxID=1202767 RepID=A0A8T4GTF3_9EURY|nr:methyltransferase domain-containing protein [Halolamina salifodinae]MBP1985680.1 demethylmenaquinone methyltransferase/2-methoxy-6-polyprenyl-1,4-benzoquinol methylase [Halolamina salifodinae]